MYHALPKELCVRDSNIAGQGIFAKTDIPTGTYLGMSHIIDNEIIYRTPLGGFLNHSNDPNCIKYYEDEKYFIKTIREIKSGEELFLKYTFYSVES